MKDYIELGRTFHELSLDGGKSDEFDHRRLRRGQALDWETLVANYRAVILSEAGSGKTAEIRQAAKSLRAKGLPAFFLRLEHVANHFDSAFEEGTFDEFSTWLGTDQEGWLFLDSVDEARLRGPQDFETAVRGLGTRIAVALQRTHIVLSSRGTAWRPTTDLALCERFLRYVAPLPAPDADMPPSPPSEASASTYKIVALDDLTPDQISMFVKAKGVDDPKPFLDAIERTDSWAMAARPDDLTELVEFWKTHTRIGNRVELMRASVARRLKEHDQTRAEAMPISDADAMSGVKTIAAVSTFAQSSTIAVPDGLENENGLPVQGILREWDSRKCAALLSRPIFDEALYGTVRFHHRTTREFLTAEWLKDLLDKDTSRRRVESLLFQRQYGVEVIIPAMRPVLVWLILLDARIRERALSLSPELAFEGGEPKALPAEHRRATLRAICRRTYEGSSSSSGVDYRAVQRFADPDIADEIKALLQKYARDSDLCAFLMRMVWQGEIKSLLPEAMAIATDRRAKRHTRIPAIRAIRTIGAPDDILTVRQAFMNETSELNRELFVELLVDLPPSSASVTWMLTCLPKLEKKPRHSFDSLPETLDTFIRQLSGADLKATIAALNALLAKRPFVERRYCEISERNGWLIKSAALAIERLIIERDPYVLTVPTLSILEKLPAAQTYRHWSLKDIRSNLPQLISDWPELNDALFWHNVASARRLGRGDRNGRVTRFWQARLFHAYWEFHPKDFDRVLSYLSERPLMDDRLVALSLAFALYQNAKRPRRWREALKARTAKIPELNDALHTMLKPPPATAEEISWKRDEAGYKRRNKRDALRRQKNAEDWNTYLRANVATIRDPGFTAPNAMSNAQYHLLCRIRTVASNNGHWTSGNWEALTPEYGPDVATAFRDGAVAFWQRNTPKLASEGRMKGTPNSTIFGLAGLAIEARETEDWPENLHPEDAERAARYAMSELNGFPDWFPALFEAFPQETSAILLGELDYNLKVETSLAEHHYVLSDISYSAPWCWGHLGPHVLARLRTRTPRHVRNLEHMVAILQGSEVDDEDIARLAETRSRDRRLAHAAIWYAVWVGVEPEKAIDAFAARLRTMRTGKTDFAMQFVTRLVGGRRSSVRTRDAYRKPHHLQALYRLMHEHIRQKDDIHRAGKGVYSPGLRDDAQDARSSLFALLKDIPGKAAYLALVELGKLHPEPSARPWMLHNAQVKAETDADMTPWSIAQVLDFQSVLERTPSNHRELFELIEMRFLDLKDELENGDTSIAGILARGVSEETDMRNFIGDWCRSRAQGRYSIPQEEELADARRPDLRGQGSGFDSPVPIELKLADRWSGEALRERLETQLCGDYLRDNRSSRGLFILVQHKERTGWAWPARRKLLDFQELVDALQNHWDARAPQFPGIDDVRVLGIDLTKRARSPLL